MLEVLSNAVAKCNYLRLRLTIVFPVFIRLLMEEKVVLHLDRGIGVPLNWKGSFSELTHKLQMQNAS